MYGMPKEVKYCVKCNVTNQTPTTTNEYEHDKNTQQIPIEFNENDICYACVVNEKKWNGKKILCGDFNNTAFSWVYRELSKNKQDAFKIAGKGLGKTFNYLYPLRIDFILVDLNFEVNNFKTFEVPYSDHFPILARVKLKDKIE